MEIKLKDEFIKLGQALKAAGLVDSGVVAKIVIQDGEVLVNGEVETRRGKHQLKQKVIHRNLDPPMCSQLTTHLQGNTSYPKTLRTSLFLRKNCVVSVKCSPHMLFEIAHPLFL